MSTERGASRMTENARPGAIVPGPARALVRSSELGLIALAAITGCLGGCAVAAMSLTTQLLREALYQIPHGTRLSAAESLLALPTLLAPALGGAFLTLFSLGAVRLRGTRRPTVIDPIEANALHGGRLSLRDSVYVALQNVISNGSGASVGLEAGYTQIAAGLASRLGIGFELRRSDLRTLVGCGAAAAIAAAFGSPLTGAFYAFELIIGTYTIATLAPVVIAALCGSLVSAALAGQPSFIDVSDVSALIRAPISAWDTLPCLALGMVCAGCGVALMRGVGLVERGLRASRLPKAAQPVFGGLCVGALALATTPQVLSGGHGALHLHLAGGAAGLGVAALAGLLLAKAAASALSIGSGFRGGLFFASLFLGALAGEMFAALGFRIWPGFDAFALKPLGYTVIGMGALAVAVVGAPLTMTFLALEMTGSFPVSALVLVAIIASSLTVRRTFGYSFATWRFHLRGESIRSAHDVGWIRSLTVERLMRRDIQPIPLDTPLAQFLRDHPLGSPSRVVMADAAGRYAGIVLVPEAHALAAEDTAEHHDLREVVRRHDDFLTAPMNAKEAVAAFDATESEALAVLDDATNRRVIGLLTESHTLKRYSEELERQRLAMAGERT